MRIVVVGAGAMGAAMGGLLAHGGSDVTLVDLNRDHMTAIVTGGLTLKHTDGTEAVVRPHATSEPGSLGGADLVFVMTKSWATTEAVRSVASAISDTTWVASAQNGLGADARIAAAGIAPERVMAGTTTVGATYVRPGVVSVSGTVTDGTSLTQFGLPRGVERPPIADEVEAAFADAGLTTEVLSELDEVVWTKLCMAGTAGCLTAAAQITIGDMFASADLMQSWQAMFREILAVAEAEGVELDADAVAAHAHRTYQSVGRHWASMAVDVRERRRTEIDAMCGEISALGRLHGIPTPVNDVVGAMIKAIEASWLAPTDQ